MVSSQNTIEFKVKLQFSELLKYGYKQYLGKISGKLITFFTAFVFVTFILDVVLNIQEMGTTFFIAYFPTMFLLAALLLIPKFALFLKYKFMFSTDRALQEEQYYSFSGTGIRIKTILNSKDVRWEEIYRVIYNKHNIIISISRNEAFIIPKRVFDYNKDYFDTLKQLIESNIPEKRLKKM